MSAAPYREPAPEPAGGDVVLGFASKHDGDLVVVFAVVWLATAVHFGAALASGRVLGDVDVLAGLLLVALPRLATGRK